MSLKTTGLDDHHDNYSVDTVVSSDEEHEAHNQKGENKKKGEEKVAYASIKISKEQGSEAKHQDNKKRDGQGEPKERRRRKVRVSSWTLEDFREKKRIKLLKRREEEEKIIEKRAAELKPFWWQSDSDE